MYYQEALRKTKTNEFDCKDKSEIELSKSEMNAK